MIRLPSRALRAGAVLGLAVLLAACGATPKVTGATSGFLPSYDSLKEVSDPGGVKYLSSGPIGIKGEKLERVFVEPSRLFPAGVRFPSVDDATATRSLQYLDTTLRAQLAKHFALVDAPQKAQLVVRPAVTRIAAVEEGMKPLDFVPVRLVTKPLKDAVLGTPQKAAAVLEVLMLDPRDGSVVNASYRPATGKETGRSGAGGDKVGFDAIRPVLDEWATSITGELVRGPRR
jgi:hypothetical protein